MGWQQPGEELGFAWVESRHGREGRKGCTVGVESGVQELTDTSSLSLRPSTSPKGTYLHGQHTQMDSDNDDDWLDSEPAHAGQAADKEWDSLEEKFSNVRPSLLPPAVACLH